jgi:hypothetical protein
MNSWVTKIEDLDKSVIKKLNECGEDLRSRITRQTIEIQHAIDKEVDNWVLAKLTPLHPELMFRRKMSLMDLDYLLKRYTIVTDKMPIGEHMFETIELRKYDGSRMGLFVYRVAVEDLHVKIYFKGE